MNSNVKFFENSVVLDCGMGALMRILPGHRLSIYLRSTPQFDMQGSEKKR